MKKWLAGIVAALVVVLAAGILATGCTPQQVQVIAQQAGMASIVTWASVDNPTDEQKTMVAGVVDVIRSTAGTVSIGGSYYAELSPVVTAYIEQKVQPQSRPLAILASGWILTGIDTFFAMYPKYAENANQALQVVTAFCDGAKMGLALTKDSPIMKAATRGSVERSKARKAIQ